MSRMPIMNKKKFFLLLLPGLIFAAQTTIASDPVPASKQKKPIALVGGIVHVVSGPTIPGGTVLFDKGKIVAVGAQVSIPADAEKIDVTGKHVYPGLIDANTPMGLTEIGSVRGTVDITETGTLNPNARAEVAVNPESELIPVARSAGITVTATTPGGGLIAGTSAAMLMDGWTGEEMTLKAPLGLVVNWPRMVYVESRFVRQPKEEWIKSRDAQLKSLKEAFVSARAYMKAKASEQEKGIPYHDTDVRWEAMVPALERKVPVFVNANELSQIQAVISWAEQESLRVVIVGGSDAWRIAEQLRATSTPVILTDILSSPSHRWGSYAESYAQPGVLQKSGVVFCIAGDGNPSNSRQLPYHAAAAAAFGLSADDALKSITLRAAEILGIADRVGSLEAGKDATLLVARGDILELSTNVEQVYIQGKKCDMMDKHKQLYAKYKEKYRQ